MEIRYIYIHMYVSRAGRYLNLAYNIYRVYDNITILLNIVILW